MSNQLDEIKADIADLERRKEIIEAHERGEEIQHLLSGSNGWRTVPEGHEVNFYKYQYRVKPVKAVIYCNQAFNVGTLYWQVYDSEERARMFSAGAERVAVKFVEAD